MNGEVRPRPREWVAPFRLTLAVLAPLLGIVVLVPPVASWAARYEFVQAVQFSVLAFVVGPLLVCGAPWRRLGLASSDTPDLDPDGVRRPVGTVRPVDRWTLSRSTASHQQRAVAAALAFAALVIFWRVAPVVDFLVHHPWAVSVEALTLVTGGAWLFTDLVESPPLAPGASRPYRIGLATGVMWTAWVVAYLDAMSHNSWYTAFHHAAGRGLSLAADQQLSAGLIWLISAVVFVPIVFWNLVYWLQSEEDPNEELGRLIREERTRGFFGTD